MTSINVWPPVNEYYGIEDHPVRVCKVKENLPSAIEA